jgi:hypothetical protein
MTHSMMRTLALGFGCLFLLFGGVAQGAAPKDQAEAQRLEGEMRTLAQKNAWSGVERAYRNLTRLKKVTIKADSHLLGAQAARTEANIDAWRQRLVAAGSAGSEGLKALDRTFGKVKIKVKKGSALTPTAGMPFDPVHRKLVDRAAASVKGKGKYKGWLPVGAYSAGDAAFTVAAGKTIKVK